MADIEQGSVRANGLEFRYLHAGSGPLALCYHGFPDSPWSYRYLLPALADSGYHAVAPFARDFAPTQLPDDRHHVHSSTMVADVLGLRDVLSGDEPAVLVAHPEVVHERPLPRPAVLARYGAGLVRPPAGHMPVARPVRAQRQLDRQPVEPRRAIGGQLQLHDGQR